LSASINDLEGGFVKMKHEGLLLSLWGLNIWQNFTQIFCLSSLQNTRYVIG